MVPPLARTQFTIKMAALIFPHDFDFMFGSLRMLAIYVATMLV